VLICVGLLSEFKLIEAKELQPLSDLISTLMGKDAKGVVDGPGAGAAAAGGASPNED